MGRSEYGIKINNIIQLKYILDVIDLHNNHINKSMSKNEVGEELDKCAILEYDNIYWLFLVNRGGRCNTTVFLKSYLPPNITFLEPFVKPPWWGKDDKELLNVEKLTNEEIINIMKNYLK